MSQAEAGARIGASGAQWGNWERGVSRPSIDELATICIGFGASAHWLLLGEGPQSALTIASASLHGFGDADGLAGMTSEQLYELAAHKARQEEVAVHGPLKEAIESLREAVRRGEAPAKRVRDLLERAIQEFDPDEDRVEVVGPPVQKDGYTEQAIRTYEKGKGDPDTPPGARRGAG